MLQKVQSYEAAESPWIFCEAVAEFRWMDFSGKRKNVHTHVRSEVGWDV